MNNFYKKGITLVEVLAVLAIMGIIALVVFPQFSRMRENQVLKNGVEDIVSIVRRAQSQTLASVDSSKYGINFQSDQVSLFKGTIYSAEDISNEIIDIVSPATISDVTFSGGATSFYFNKLTGAPNITGTITISSPNFSKIIIISATGAVSVN